MNKVLKPISDEEATSYLVEDNGRVKRDCWLKPMHIRYNEVSDRFELVTCGHTYHGDRGLCTLESFAELTDIPYVGNWVKCNEQGEDIE